MKFIVKIILLIAILMPVYAPAVSAQGLNDDVCNGVVDSNTGEDPTFCQDNEEQKGESPEDNSLYGPNGLITRIVRLLSLVIGIAAVIMIIIGGIRYVTSSGDPNNTNGAKNTIMFAIVGLLVALLAQAIIIFVISKI